MNIDRKLVERAMYYLDACRAFAVAVDPDPSTVQDIDSVSGDLRAALDADAANAHPPSPEAVFGFSSVGIKSMEELEREIFGPAPEAPR